MLIVPFVMVYTQGITDANYYQPLFGILLLVAEAIYCSRVPFVSVAYASGHFKETSKYAYIEAGMNIVISVAMVKQFGLVGVAIGTLLSMAYRMIMHVIYLRKNILHRPIKKFLKNLLIFLIPVFISVVVCHFTYYEVNTYVQWILKAIITAVLVSLTMGITLFFTRKELLVALFRRIVNK